MLHRFATTRGMRATCALASFLAAATCASVVRYAGARVPATPAPMWCQSGVTLKGISPEWDGNYMSFVPGKYNLDTMADVPELVRYDNRTIATAGGTDFDPALADQFIDKWLLMQQTSKSDPVVPYVCGRFIPPDIWPKPGYVPCQVYAVCEKGCPSIPGHLEPFEKGALWDAAIWPLPGNFTTEWQLLNNSRPKRRASVAATCCEQRPNKCRACKPSACSALGPNECGHGANNTCCQWSRNGGFMPPSCGCIAVQNQCA